MKAEGVITKMSVHLNHEDGAQVEYKLFRTNTLPMHSFVGKQIRITHSGRYACTDCQKEVKKLFGQGFCFPCFQNSPQNSPCIIRPELCQAHLGIGRDMEWETKCHLQDHIVYLTAGDQIKVGITQQNNIPSRWIDQGAIRAIIVARTKNRYLAGVLEVALKDFFSDKTNWQKMLKNDVDLNIDLVEAKWEVAESLPQDMVDQFVEDDSIMEINYPVLQYPEKIKSLKLETTPMIEGKLVGIKGQYLIFENDSVINIRSHAGYHVLVECLG